MNAARLIHNWYAGITEKDFDLAMQAAVVAERQRHEALPMHVTLSDAEISRIARRILDEPITQPGSAPVEGLSVVIGPPTATGGPLYVRNEPAPMQPLTDWQMDALGQELWRVGLISSGPLRSEVRSIVRAVERAHGIGVAP